MSSIDVARIAILGLDGSSKSSLADALCSSSAFFYCSTSADRAPPLASSARLLMPAFDDGTAASSHSHSPPLPFRERGAVSRRDLQQHVDRAKAKRQSAAQRGSDDSQPRKIEPFFTPPAASKTSPDDKTGAAADSSLAGPAAATPSAVRSSLDFRPSDDPALKPSAIAEAMRRDSPSSSGSNTTTPRTNETSPSTAMPAAVLPPNFVAHPEDDGDDDAVRIDGDSSASSNVGGHVAASSRTPPARGSVARTARAGSVSLVFVNSGSMDDDIVHVGNAAGRSSMIVTNTAFGVIHFGTHLASGSNNGVGRNNALLAARQHSPRSSFAFVDMSGSALLRGAWLPALLGMSLPHAAPNAADVDELHLLLQQQQQQQPQETPACDGCVFCIDACDVLRVSFAWTELVQLLTRRKHGAGASSSPALFPVLVLFVDSGKAAGSAVAAAAATPRMTARKFVGTLLARFAPDAGALFQATGSTFAFADAVVVDGRELDVGGVASWILSAF